MRTITHLARTDRPGAVLILGALLWASWSAVAVVRTPRGPWLAATLAAAIVWSVHGARRDGRFLHSVGARLRRVWATEYLAVGLPLALIVLILRADTLSADVVVAAVAIPLACALAAVAPPGWLERVARAHSARRRARLPAPADAFEWMSGVRRTWPMLALIYLLGLLIGWRLPEAGVVAMGVLAYLAAGWYGNIDEGWPLVVAFRRTPGGFLLRKCSRALLLYACLAVPFVLLVLARHPHAWRGLVLVGIAAPVLIVGAVLFKYSRYWPGEAAPVASAFALLVLTASLVIPPAAVGLLLVLWQRATHTLSRYVGVTAPLRKAT